MSVTREDLIAEARRRGLLPPAETAAAAPAAPSSAPPAAPAGPTDRLGALEHAGRVAAAEFIGNVIGLPHAAGELLALGAAVPETVTGAVGAAVRGEPLELGRRFGEARAAQEQQFPASALRRLPNPSAEDVLRTAEAVKAVPGAVVDDVRRFQTEGGAAPNPLDALATARERGAAAVEAAVAEHPVATAVGEIGGDIATLVSGRPTIKSLLNLRNPARVVPKAKEAADRATGTLMRGLGRSAEAGFEGAVIGALSDADPATTAAWSAGVQAGGSMALQLKEAVRRAPLKSFATLWVAHEMLRAVAPGTQDAFTSKDESIRELVAAYGLGVIASLAGAGRGGDANRIADAVSAASRAGIASVISQLQSAEERGETHYGEIVAKITEDPDYFGAEARRRLEIAARRERPNALLTEIDALMRSNPFRRKYERLQQEESAAE